MIAALAAALVAFAAPAASAPAAAGATVQGQLRSAGERLPVAGARIFAASRRGPAWTREATAAIDGSFVLTDLPDLEFTLIVVAAGHERLEVPTTSNYWRRRAPPTIFVRPSGSVRYRTTVTQRRNPKPATFSTSLSPEEIAAAPGSQGDPLRALQNLPGVARPPGGLGLLILRGATPNQSQVFYGEHPLPRAFHLPGLASVVPAAALAGIEYTPGNFDSSYGNAVGGIVTMLPRLGRRDGTHGLAKVDITSAGASVEGPFGRGSYLLAAQRGYLDLALRALGRDILGQSALIRPRYYDYQLVFDHPVGPGATLTARALGARDDLRYPLTSIGLDDVPETRLDSTFHRLDLAYRKRHGAWDFLLAPAVRLDRAAFSLATIARGRTDVVGLFRGEITVRPAQRFRLTVGADTQLDRFIGWAYSPESPTTGAPAEYRRDRGLLTMSGLYITPMLSLGRWTLVPGARLSAFTGRDSRSFAVDPRLMARWAVHDRVDLNFGAGLYSQPSLVVIGTSSNLLIGGPGQTTIGGYSPLVLPGAVRYLDARLELEPMSRVGATRAVQLSANVHLDLPASLALDGTVFYRHVRLGSQPTFPIGDREVANPDSGSVTWGLEAMLRKELTGRLYGWIAYTYMRSRLGVYDIDRLRLRFPAEFDQRHNLVMVLGLKLPKRWELGARFRVVTGLPYTPYVGAVAIDNIGTDYVPLVGAIHSARLPVIHQLDVRVDKTWILPRTIVSAYLDVQNVYNRQNPEGVLYNADYTDTRAVVGVPILPVLGLSLRY